MVLVMADVVEADSLNQVPLLLPIKDAEKVEDEEEADAVGDTLKWLELFLSILGFKQSSGWSLVLWWSVFSLVGVVVPVLILLLTECSGDCERYQINKFELDIMASQACLAAVSLLCLSHNLRKYGIRKFLFVDRCNGHMVRFRDDYIHKILSVRLLTIWVLLCFFLKTGREILRLLNVHHESWWVSLSILFGLVGSWTYTCIVYLSACVVFHLVCNLQITHFDDYVRLLEREGDVLVLIEDHTRLRYYLSKISHRFRIFLVLEFVVVSASQIVTLFQTTASSGKITIINGGDFAISSLVQVVGVILCLNGAAKISHRAQGLAAVASRWHSLATCRGSADGLSQIRSTNSAGNVEATITFNSFQSEYSESDLESLEFCGIPSNTQFPSHMSSYHRRQSFVLYLQNNPGGITIYGWTVDRGLITTIFCIELTLVTFVLGKTVVFTA
uniref:Gustatory receptor n=1 Tax=Kalanchoe fedtschenkoi TaxID=63787 RepID=A0A7N0VJI8_KALFE